MSNVKTNVFGETPVAATLVYQTRRVMVYAVRYQTKDTAVSYRKHRTPALDTHTARQMSLS
jgi:hypothetical protein